VCHFLKLEKKNGTAAATANITTINQDLISLQSPLECTFLFLFQRGPLDLIKSLAGRVLGWGGGQGRGVF